MVLSDPVWLLDLRKAKRKRLDQTTDEGFDVVIGRTLMVITKNSAVRSFHGSIAAENHPIPTTVYPQVQVGDFHNKTLKFDSGYLVLMHQYNKRRTYKGSVPCSL